MYLKALELGNTAIQDQLRHFYSLNLEDNTDKIETVKRLFEISDAIEATTDAIADYTEKAFAVLSEVNLPDEKKVILREFGMWLMNRKL